MYRLEITRFGSKNPALPIDRKTEKGAAGAALKHCIKHAQDGDIVRVFKKGARTPAIEFKYRIENYWLYAQGPSNKREKLVFGKPTGELI